MAAYFVWKKSSSLCIQPHLYRSASGDALSNTANKTTGNQTCIYCDTNIQTWSQAISFKIGRGWRKSVDCTKMREELQSCCAPKCVRWCSYKICSLDWDIGYIETSVVGCIIQGNLFVKILVQCGDVCSAYFSDHFSKASMLRSQALGREIHTDRKFLQGTKC